MTNGRWLMTTRARRSHDAGDRPCAERDRDHDGDRDDVVKAIGVEPGEDAFAVDDCERGFETEAKKAAHDQSDEERLRLDLERAGGEHERRERKGRRNEIERGERDRAAPADTV